MVERRMVQIPLFMYSEQHVKVAELVIRLSGYSIDLVQVPFSAVYFFFSSTKYSSDRSGRDV